MEPTTLFWLFRTTKNTVVSQPQGITPRKSVETYCVFFHQMMHVSSTVKDTHRYNAVKSMFMKPHYKPLEYLLDYKLMLVVGVELIGYALISLHNQPPFFV